MLLETNFRPDFRKEILGKVHHARIIPVISPPVRDRFISGHRSTYVGFARKSLEVVHSRILGPVVLDDASPAN
jgi:hypothetical protein